MRGALLAAAMLALAIPFAPAAGQTGAGTGPGPAATLVADSVRINADETLLAEGNVEVIFEGVTLTASRVTFDRTTNQLTIDGPIRLTEPSGSVLIADEAQLDAELTNGLMRSARLVLDRQLQLAAAEIQRDGARYTRLRRVAASSCEVCDASATPLWEIRASGVVHDQLERQLYFEDAQVRIGGLPVFYLPRLRIPDPTRDRATGFLIPDLRSSSELGTGIKTPYFVRLGDSSDLTLTPYVAPGTRTLELQYRQAFVDGNLQFDGAYTFSDDILNGDSRGYAFLRGAFRLPNEYRLTFDVETVSDDAYLLDYDISDKDRLDSELALTRTRDDAVTRFGITRYETLRAADIGVEDTLPSLEADLFHTQRLPTGALGGDAWLTFDGSAITRPSQADVDGRDVLRLGVAADWRRGWLAPGGVVIDAEAGLAFDVYRVANDSNFDPDLQRTTPRAALTLRWPLEKTEATGARQILEPVVQLAWAESLGDDAPNEDSLLVEFDEGNLFSLSRFPGVDEYEEGLRANIGLGWRRTTAQGLTFGATLGRVIRAEPSTQFATGTGLSGDLSDWLAVFRVELDNRLRLVTRSLISDSFSFTMNETRLDWSNDRSEISTSYVWSVAEPEENRPDRLSEWALGASYDFNRNWQGRVGWRYDFVANRAARAGLGVRYLNECIGVDLSVSRRFTSSTSVSPTTDLSLRVSLNGFGTSTSGQEFRRSCNG